MQLRPGSCRLPGSTSDSKLLYTVKGGSSARRAFGTAAPAVAPYPLHFLLELVHGIRDVRIHAVEHCA